MAAQQGRAVLLKIGTGTGSPEVFETVAGLRSNGISLNAREVDVTNADSANAWRELLAGAGFKSASISGAGVFKDASADARIRDAFFNQTNDNWQVIVPDFGVIEGAFQVETLEYSGEFSGEATYSLSLRSAGALTFTAV